MASPSLPPCRSVSHAGCEPTANHGARGAQAYRGQGECDGKGLVDLCRVVLLLLDETSVLGHVCCAVCGAAKMLLGLVCEVCAVV